MKTNDRAHVDKRITSTRNTILDAAISLYRKLGIEKTSISQVIDLSEVGRSTFYRHCSGRDDLLNQVLNRDFDALMLEFQSVSRCYESLEEQIEEDMLWFLEQFIRRPALSLVCSDIKWQRYQQTAESLSAFRRA